MVGQDAGGEPRLHLEPFPYAISPSTPHARYFVAEAYCVPAPSETPVYSLS